nr:14570_t:CDS:2 [Entrophospora candida]
MLRCVPNYFRVYRKSLNHQLLISKYTTKIRLISSNATVISSENNNNNQVQIEKENDIVHKGDHYVQIPNRALIEIHGENAVKFLQGLITNNMPLIQNGGDGFYAAFLNTTGRVLYDTFIYPKNIGSTFPHPTFLIECDSRGSSHLINHLKKYLLRSKIVITDVSSHYNAWSIWGKNINNLWWQHQIPKPFTTKLPTGTLVLKERINEIGCKDKRYPDMGLRLVLPADTKPILPSSFTELPSIEYTIRRILHGIPEGIDDFETGTSLPLQSNFDYMGGIDFHKGCYIGQELTFRTYHTGVTRKRIIPIQLYREGESKPTTLVVDRKYNTSSSDLPPPHKEIVNITDNKKGRSIGNIGSSCYNVALALLRLDKLKMKL